MKTTATLPLTQAAVNTIQPGTCFEGTGGVIFMMLPPAGDGSLRLLNLVTLDEVLDPPSDTTMVGVLGTIQSIG